MAKRTYKQIYNESELFRHYVDKYAKSRKLTVDEALTHEIIRQYAKYLGEIDDEA